MKLSGTYKYFKVAQLIKALFIPMLLFTQADYKSAGKNTVTRQFVNLSDKMKSEQKVHEGFNNFRVNCLNAMPGGNSFEELRTNQILYNQIIFKQ
jgi:hypothetical protein